jgi:hypothetical protein
MPPHCDSLAGPVVTAARRALDADDVELVLPYVPEESEAEVRAVFGQVADARVLGGEARIVADRHFFETVVRLHRAGEGAPYTGLKPEGTPTGPVIPMAERAVLTGKAEEVSRFLAAELTDEVERRLADVHSLAGARERSVADARRYVEAMLGFEVYCHTVYKTLRAMQHSEAEGAATAAHHHG